MSDFWTAHPLLVDIKRFARARGVGEWGLLGVLMMRCCAALDPAFVLPPIVGARASLNSFVALVAPSGGGKTVALSASHDFMGFGFSEAPEHNVGTAQGIASVFMEPDRDHKGANAPLVRNATPGALFTSDEVTTLMTLAGQKDSILQSELCTMWSGGRIGQKNADPARSREVPKGSYRLCLVVGVQPARSSLLLDEATGGLPQRFLWLPSRSPDMTRPGRTERAWADAHERLNWGQGRPPAGPVIPVCEEAQDDVERVYYAPESERELMRLDSHGMLCRLKAAAVLSALCTKRIAIDREWWLLSGLLMAQSLATRRLCEESLLAERRERGRRDGIEQGARMETAAAIAAEEQVGRIGRRMLHLLEDGPVGTRDFMHAFAGRDKRSEADGSSPFSTALRDLRARGLVVEGGQAKADRTYKVFALARDQHLLVLLDEFGMEIPEDVPGQQPEAVEEEDTGLGVPDGTPEPKGVEEEDTDGE